MDSPPTVDPDLQPLLDLLPPVDLTVETLPGLRDFSVAMSPPLADRPDLTRREVLIPSGTDAPDVRVLLTMPSGPAAGPRPALLWIHGGGYVMGRPERSQPLADELAEQLECVVVAVAYRLSPETAYPGALDDCYAALSWMHSQPDGLDIDIDRIAVAGESAGGGLAANLSLLARDRGDIDVALSVLIYPMLDDRTVTTTDPNPNAGQYVWLPGDNAFAWRAYLGADPGGEEVGPYAAAARCADVAGLPPTFIAVGALDLFVDEDLDYAHRLVRAGVPTELHVYPGTFHGFLNFVGAWPAIRLRAAMTAALRRTFTATNDGTSGP